MTVQTRSTVARAAESQLPRAKKPYDHATAARVGSCLWAAYGDALGFMFHRGLRRPWLEGVDRLGSWSPRRPLGGEATFPAGIVSDDTQLRLATSRSVANGGFDVYTFSRIELPTWPSYALTADREEKVPALNLVPQESLWWANTYRRWTSNSGSGGAVRIQPHVWAAQDKDDWMTDVIVNSVCTHGHPRAILAACFHAACLDWCLRTGTPPTLDECRDIASDLMSALGNIEDHPQLRSWMGVWKRHTDSDFASCWQGSVRELVRAIRHIPSPSGDLKAWYEDAVYSLGYGWVHPVDSGGLESALLASAVASVVSDPYSGVMITANGLCTRPVPISTMVGALLGACFSNDPPEDLLDHAYLRAEAERLSALARGEKVKSHEYPDVLTWEPPKTQVGALNIRDGELEVPGLGPVRALGDARMSPKGHYGWQWVRTDYGQTLLVKRRGVLKNMTSLECPSPTVKDSPPAIGTSLG